MNKNHLIAKDGKSKSRWWVQPKEDMLAELTEQFKEDRIQALLALETEMPLEL